MRRSGLNGGLRTKRFVRTGWYGQLKRHKLRFRLWNVRQQQFAKFRRLTKQWQCFTKQRQQLTGERRQRIEQPGKISDKR